MTKYQKTYYKNLSNCIGPQNVELKLVDKRMMLHNFNKYTFVFINLFYVHRKICIVHNDIKRTELFEYKSGRP